MRWRAGALSAGSIALAALVWFGSPYVLDRTGLGDFDPLTRIVLLFLVLSAAELGAARWSGR